MIEITIANNSASGIEIQIPLGPNIAGSIKSIPRMNTNVRKNDINAEIFPFDTLVKNTDAKILKPANK